MTALALARSWRPKTFSQLVGQDHVVKALTHALDQDQLHHAPSASIRGTDGRFLLTEEKIR